MLPGNVVFILRLDMTTITVLCLVFIFQRCIINILEVRLRRNFNIFAKLQSNDFFLADTKFITNEMQVISGAVR